MEDDRCYVAKQIVAGLKYASADAPSAEFMDGVNTKQTTST